jgi:hypothetical protein
MKPEMFLLKVSSVNGDLEVENEQYLFRTKEGLYDFARDTFDLLNDDIKDLKKDGELFVEGFDDNGIDLSVETIEVED